MDYSFDLKKQIYVILISGFIVRRVCYVSASGVLILGSSVFLKNLWKSFIITLFLVYSVIVMQDFCHCCHCVNNNESQV